jgi:hypothetical protein
MRALLHSVLATLRLGLEAFPEPRFRFFHRQHFGIFCFRRRARFFRFLLRTISILHHCRHGATVT